MRDSALTLVVLSLLAGCTGDEPGGLTLRQQYEQAKKTADPRSRAIRLIQIAYEQDKAGDVQGVHESLAAAAEAAREISDAAEKAETLASVAYAAGVVGWITEASQLVKELRSAIEPVEDKKIAAAATAKMAAVYGAHLENGGAADLYIRQAEEIAGQIEEPESRASALLSIAGRRFELEQPEEAVRVTDAALEAAQSIENLRRRADTLAEVAVRYHKIGQAEESLATFDEAIAAAESISENYVSQSYALLNVAEKLHAAGHKQQALAVLDKTEKAADQILDQGQKGPFMTKFHQLRNRLL